MKFDIVKTSFWLTFALTLAGAILKLQKLDYSSVFLTLGIIALILYFAVIRSMVN